MLIEAKLLDNIPVRPNKKISVFRVTGLKILGSVGTHIYFFFLEFFFMHFERHFTCTSSIMVMSQCLEVQVI